MSDSSEQDRDRNSRHPSSSRGGIHRILGEQSSVVAAMFVLSLVFSLSIWVFSYRALYGDASNLLLKIIQTKYFFHVSTNRATATFLTQSAPVAAIHAGVRSIPALIMIYTFGLAIVPIICHSTAIWIARRDPLLFGASALVIVCCFYPMSFLLVSEANIYLALFWLSFILLLTYRTDSVSCSSFLLLASIAALRAYETSALFSVVLSALCIARFRASASPIARTILVLAGLLFLVGSGFGLTGIVFPRDVANEAGFAMGLSKFWQNGTFLSNLLLTSMAIAAAFVPDRLLRLGIAAMAILGFLAFSISRIEAPALLSLGYVVDQRAQTFVVLAGLTLVLLVAKSPSEPVIAVRAFHPLALAIPLITVVVLDAYDSLDERAYLDQVCAQLSPGGPGPSSQFFETPAPKKFGWNWTFPTVSVLLRPLGSQKLLVEPSYAGWQPFSTAEGVPDIDQFKAHGTFCHS
jgi:hypothetical protein